MFLRLYVHSSPNTIMHPMSKEKRKLRFSFMKNKHDLVDESNKKPNKSKKRLVLIYHF